MNKDEARALWREMHKNCHTVAAQVEMTQTAIYEQIVEVLFPEGGGQNEVRPLSSPGGRD